MISTRPDDSARDSLIAGEQVPEPPDDTASMNLIASLQVPSDCSQGISDSRGTTTAPGQMIAQEHVPEPPDWVKEAQARAGEPLDPELEPYIEYGTGIFGRVLKHPLVFEVPLIDEWAYRANDQLARKRAALTTAIGECDWDSAVYLHERPYRVGAFASYAGLMTDEEYWSLLGDIYVDTENFWQESRRWEKMLTADRPDRHEFMTGEEREFLDSLPEKLTVYRGFNGRGKRRSWSWTLDRGRGIWFAERLNRENRGKPPTLITGTIPKRYVVVTWTGGVSRRSLRRPAVLSSPDRREFYEMLVPGVQGHQTRSRAYAT